jgi:hypothetical protein
MLRLQNILQINLHDEKRFQEHWNSRDLLQSLFRTNLYPNKNVQ